jgi:hypothetical protein
MDEINCTIISCNYTCLMNIRGSEIKTNDKFQSHVSIQDITIMLSHGTPVSTVTKYFSIVKSTRCTISRIYFIFGQHSTRFGQSLRPSSGVQDCTYSIRYMSYRFCGCLLAGMKCNISFPLKSSHRTCMV